MKLKRCVSGSWSVLVNRVRGHGPQAVGGSAKTGPWLRWALAAALLGGMGVPAGSAWAADVDVQVSSFTDSPDPALRGGQITYTTVLKNGGPAIATNVVVTWPVPATTTFVSGSDDGGGVCSHNGANPGVVTCTYASVPVDNSSDDWNTIALVVQTTASTPASINTTATATQTDNTDTNPSNNSLSQTTTINNGADLSFAISGAANPSVGAGNVTWSINGSNLGPDTSGPITVTVPIPGTLTYVSGSGGGWSCGYSAPNAVCTRAALTSGSAYPALSIVTKITSQIVGGTLTVGGSIAETGVGDPVASNNGATASVMVNPGLDLQITQDVPSPNSANAGGAAMTFVLRPTNLGPYDATTGATVSFPLPAGFSLASANGTNGWTCTSAGSPITVTCSTNSNFASGATSVLTIVTGTPVTVPVSTQYSLIGTVAVNASGPTDPIAGNNTASRDVIVVPEGLDLSLTKNKTPAIVAAGANMTSTIVVKSATGGVQAASGTITVVDVLDITKETYVSGAGTNWACVESPVGTVTCTYNDTLNGGANAQTLTITTKAVADGTATNNATVGYSGTPGDYNSANNTIGASATVTAVPNSPDLIAGITVSTPGGAATTLEVGESTVTYIATLTNDLATNVDAVNTKMTLTIPALVSGVTDLGTITVNVPGTSTATYSCPAPTATLSTSTIVCTQTGGTLTKGDVVTFTVPISRALKDGTFTNGVNVAVTSTTQGDPTPGNNAAAATVIIDPIADIELVSKNITSANPAIAGTNVTYVVTIRNNGPSAAAGVAMSDVFTIPGGDTGFTFISASASDSGTCSGLTANTNYPSGSPTLNCSWASAVNSAATRTVTVIVRPNWMATPPSPRQLGNVASVITTTAESTTGSDNGNNSKSALLNIDPAQVDALINNTDNVDPLGYDPAAAAIGTANITNDIVYDVAVTNNGPSLATGVGFTYTMTPPAGKTIVFRGDGAATTVASSNTSGTIVGSICNNVGSSVTGPASLILTCMFTGSQAELINQAITHRYLVFRVGTSPATGGDTYNTNSTVITNETDSLASNNNEAETTTVRRRVDLTIAKAPSLATVQIRQPYNWTITLTNTGPGDSDVTTLTDTLPTGMEFSGAAPSFTTTGGKNGTCGVAGQVLTCNISTSSAIPFVLNEVATVTVPVRMTAYPTVPSAGTARNCASATTDQVDPTSVNNTAVCSDVAVQRSSLAGRVFNDPNRDGNYLAAGTEIGLNGWSITLTGTDFYGNAVNLTQITAGSGGTLGTYLFNNLSPADATGYVLTQTQLTTHVNGPTDPTSHVLSGTPAALDQGVYSRGGLTGSTTYTAIKLAGNQAGTNFNFPEVKRPSLSGVVYVDINNNNVYNAGTDTNIAGATVVLRNAADLGNSVATTTTAADGTYSFANLDPLITYVVEEPLPATPAGLVNKPLAVNVGTVNAVATGAALPDTAGNNVATPNTDQITGIVLSSGIDGINYNFGENQTTTISGLVYVDRDRNGTLSAVDVGRIAGVSIELRQGGASCATATVVGTTTTAVNGTYTFPGGDVVAAQVVAGANYRVCEVQPTNYNDGGTNVGTNGTSTGANDIVITNLPSSGSINNNFGEQGTNLSGYVYQDYGSGTAANDDNGGFDISENGIVNVPVTLLNTGTNDTVIVNTAVGGRYDFYDLPAGTYTVTEGAIPAASGTYVNGRTTAGTVGGASLGTAGNDTITAIALGKGVDGINYNFGELLPAGTVTGMVYIDGACNAVKDAADTQGVPGVTVRLVQGADCATGTTIQTAAITTATGVYTFSGVGANANYLICKTPPVGYGTGAPTSNFIGINNLPVAGSGGNNFGQCVGSISGSVYRDFGTATPADTNNGVRDAGELGIANVPVTLTGTDAAGTVITTTVTTDATGNYVFPGLLEANATGYTVREGAIPPASGSFSDGKDTAGNAATAAGNATTVNDQISGVLITAGQNASGYLFGELAPPVIPTLFPDLVVTKTTPTTRIAEGDVLNYTLIVKNLGQAATAGAYTVTDTLPATTGTPAKWTLESASGTDWTCAITADKLSVSCTTSAVLQPGALNPSAIALSVKVGTGAAAFSPLRNVVQISDGGEPEGSKPQPPELNAPKTCAASPEFNVCQLETPIAQPDLVVTKTTTSARISEGQVLNYTLSVKNAGLSATVGSYTVTDALPTTTGTPAKWTLESATGTGWTCAITADKLSVSCTASAVLQPGELNPSVIALSVKVGTGAAAFTPLRNVVQVSGGGEPEGDKPQPPELNAPKTCAASPEFNVCQLETPVDQSAPDMVVTKAASKTVFTEGNLGAYVLRVKNTGAAATNGVYTVTDRLPANSGNPAKWTIEGASGNGWACTVSGDQLSVSCDASAVLQPGAESPSTIAVSVRLASGAVPFGPLRNVVQVTGGGEPDDKKPQPAEVANPPLCSVAPTSNICFVDTPLQRAAGLSGHVWIDGGTKKVLDASDKRLPQWIVEVYDMSDPAAQGKTFTELVRGGLAKQTYTTDSQGYYEACNLEPKSTYRILFRDPANRIAFPGVVTNEQGLVTGSDYYSQVKDREGFQVLEVNLPSGNGGPGCGGQGVAAPEQSLPLDPNGVVYDSTTRAPVPGAKVTLLPEGICTGYDPLLHVINYETYGKDAQGNPFMITGDNGFYKFLLSGDPTAPQSCQFRLTVEEPAGYKPAPSTSIGPKPPLLTPAGPGIFNVQPQKSAPTGNEDTSYHFLLNLGLKNQEVFNNHVPLDPFVPGNIVLTKQGDKRLVEVGDTVLYTITVRLLEGDPVGQATVRDRLPAGFTLVRGTVRVNNVPVVDPLGGLGPVLGFNLGPLKPNVEAKLTYRVRVGVGAQQGDGVNTARAHGCSTVAGCLDPISLVPLANSVASNEAQYKVEVTGGVFTDSACVLGKVFVDCNNNHLQDAEELGIPGVRLYFEDGRFMVSDSEGKYSHCGLTPRSHVLAPDPSTLPKGARLTTSSNRNLGDANSLFIDLKNGELHRADFIEGSCSNPVLEQVKARRTQGEVRSVETEKDAGPALRFLSKPPGTPQQGTDSANQPLVQPRQGGRDAR